MQTVTIEIKESAIEKVMYLLEHLKDDVRIINNDDIELEVIDKNDSDYKYILTGRERRENGEKIYSVNEVMKDYKWKL